MLFSRYFAAMAQLLARHDPLRMTSSGIADASLRLALAPSAVTFLPGPRRIRPSRRYPSSPGIAETARRRRQIAEGRLSPTPPIVPTHSPGKSFARAQKRRAARAQAL